MGAVVGDAVKEDGLHTYVKRPGSVPGYTFAKPKTPFAESLMEGAGLWLRLGGYTSSGEDKF